VTGALHFSDCQAGAAAGCVPGNNTNPGTAASPKQNLSGINVNALPAGSTLLFARGGSWNFSINLDNLNATSAAPLTFADYGTGALPVFNTPSGNAFTFGRYGTAVVDGGYTIRNIKLDGRGTGLWGAFVQAATRDVTFDGVEITGFTIGIHSQQAAGASNERLTIRNSILRNNIDHGFLGDSNGLLIEGSLFEGNNPSGGGFEHGAYLGGRSTSTTVRNSIFRNNSAPGGVCNGGSLTIHGQYDNVLIEGNTIEQVASAGNCWLLSITTGYGTAEWFRNLVVRNNRLINGGNASMVVHSAVNALIEGNVAWSNQADMGQAAIVSGGAGTSGGGDDDMTGGTIRNNTACYPVANQYSTVLRNSSPGAVIENNVMRTGADATTGACAR
jgi:hypothetical protein